MNQPLGFAEAQWNTIPHDVKSKIGIKMNRDRHDQSRGKYTAGYVAPDLVIGLNRYGPTLKKILSRINFEEYSTIQEIKTEAMKRLRNTYPANDYLGIDTRIAMKTIDKLLGVNIKKGRKFKEEDHKRDSDGKFATKEGRDVIRKPKIKKLNFSVDKLQSRMKVVNASKLDDNTHSLFLFPDGEFRKAPMKAGLGDNESHYNQVSYAMDKKNIPNMSSIKDYMYENDILMISMFGDSMGAKGPSMNEAQSSALRQLVRDRGYEDTHVHIPMISRLTAMKWTEKSSITKSTDFNNLLGGLILGLGGAATYKVIENKLKKYYDTKSIKSQVIAAIGSGIVIGGLKRVLFNVKKGNDEVLTFITLQKNTDNMVKWQRNVIAALEGFNLGDHVVTKAGNKGIIRELGGSHVTIQTDKGVERLMADYIMPEKDLIMTNKGATTWRIMTNIERSDLIKSMNLPNSLASTNWRAIDKKTQELIKEHGIKDDDEIELKDGDKEVKKEYYPCPHCGNNTFQYFPDGTRMCGSCGFKADSKNRPLNKPDRRKMKKQKGRICENCGYQQKIGGKQVCPNCGKRRWKWAGS